MIYLYLLVALFAFKESLSVPTAGLLNNTSFVYDRGNRFKSFRGVFLVLHGCQRSAYDFFPKSSSCKDCRGSPVFEPIVAAMLSFNFLVIAPSCPRAPNGCWEPPDRFQVVQVLSHAYELNNLHTNHTRIPLYFFGSSGGGKFASLLLQWTPSFGFIAHGAILLLADVYYSEEEDGAFKHLWNIPIAFVNQGNSPKVHSPVLSNVF